MSAMKIDNVVFDNIKLGKAGRSTKLLYVNDGSKGNLKVSTPKLILKFLNSTTKEWANFTEFSMDCSIHDIEDENSLLEFSNNINKRIIEENRSTYEDQAYFSMIKENKNYPKMIKLVFPRDSNGNFETVVFDKEKNKVMITEDNIEDIFKRNLTMKCIIECVKVWNVNSKYGLIWNVTQILCGDVKEMQKSNYTASTHDNPVNVCLID